MAYDTPRQLELALGPTYVAVTANGDSIGEFPLADDASYFPQPKAADHPSYADLDSCVGRF